MCCDHCRLAAQAEVYIHLQHIMKLHSHNPFLHNVLLYSHIIAHSPYILLCIVMFSMTLIVASSVESVMLIYTIEAFRAIMNDNFDSNICCIM